MMHPPVTETFCPTRPVIWLAALAMLGIVGFTAFTHHAYWLTGDSELAFRQGTVLRDGYFETNIPALRAAWNGGAEALPRVTLDMEGGFPILLYAAQFLGERAPFLVNAFLLPLLLLGLGLLCAAADDRRERGRLCALMLPAFALGFPQTAEWFWNLALPSRDALACVLGLYGLCAAAYPAQETRCPGRWIFLSGLLLGLATWTRLPAAGLAPVAALFILAGTVRHGWKRIAACLGLWTIALAVGLIPYFLQNMLEGRPFFAPAAAVFAPDPSVGWHPANIAAMLTPNAMHLFSMLPIWLHALAGLGLVAGLILRGGRRQAWFLAAPAVVLLVLSSGCPRVMPQNLFIVSLFEQAIAAATAGSLLYLALLRVHSPRLRIPVSVAVTLVCAVQGAFACAPFIAPRDGLRDQWQTAQGFAAWLKKSFKPDDFYVTYDDSLRLWLDYFRPRAEGPPPPWDGDPMTMGGRTLAWKQDPMDIERNPVFDALCAGRAVFFVSPEPRPGREQPSWWRNALLNQYELRRSPRDITLDLKPVRRLVIYRVVPMKRTSVTVPVYAAKPSVQYLYLYSRALPVTGGVTAVSIKWDGQTSGVPAAIRAGPNLVRLPQPLKGPPANITIEAGTPLSLPAAAQWLAHGETASIALTSYNLVASHSLLFTGATLWWLGYPEWQRDWGGYGESRWESTPHFVLETNAAILIPFEPRPGPERLVLRLHFMAFGSDASALGRFAPTGYRIRGKPVKISTMEQAGAVRISGEMQGARFMHELDLAPELWQGGAPAELHIAGPFPTDSFDEGLALRRVEFFLKEPPKPAAPATAPAAPAPGTPR